MSHAAHAVSGLLGAALALAVAVVAVRTGALIRENYAGRRVPAVLGIALVAGTLGGAWAGSLASADNGLRFPVGAALVAVAVVFAAGFVDDLRGGGPRGFRGHLGSLRRGTPTTGTVKLVAGVAAGIWLAVALGGGAARIAASAVLIAASANVWNAMDVVPGRALKLGILVFAPVLAAASGGLAATVAWAAAGAALAILPLDLAERGMLGDAGSNPLGLVVGFGLAIALPTQGVVVAALGALALQAAAETVTISRLIEAAPPARWIDGLWRR